MTSVSVQLFGRTFFTEVFFVTDIVNILLVLES